MDAIRIPLEITTWRIWDSPGPVLKLYLHLLLLTYTQPGQSGATGLVCASVEQLAIDLDCAYGATHRGLRWLETAGYLHRLPGAGPFGAPGWRIAGAEMFDCRAGAVAVSDPATTPSL